MGYSSEHSEEFPITKVAVSERLSIVFFFSSRRRHTRLQGDWSSDVCSSDLCRIGGARALRTLAGLACAAAAVAAAVAGRSGLPNWGSSGLAHARRARMRRGIGRGWGRGRGEVLVGGGSFKKKKKRVEVSYTS